METAGHQLGAVAATINGSRRRIGNTANSVFIHSAGPTLTAAHLRRRSAAISRSLDVAVKGFDDDALLLAETATEARAADSAATPNATIGALDGIDSMPKRQRSSVERSRFSTAFRQIANFADDYFIDSTMERIRNARVGANLLVTVSPLAPVAPYGRRAWNHFVGPYLVGELIETAEDVFSLGRTNTNDRQHHGGDLGGRFTTRPSSPPTIRGGTGEDRGRSAIVTSLNNTADSTRIHPDEFEIIDHGNNRYTLVLAGVTDLSQPNRGLNPQHRSVRDTDYAAARSAASSSVQHNKYAQYVMRFTTEQLPVGASLSIVGHSFGADTALDLAADPTFNGQHFNVTHVTAAAYHSEPQLASVPDGTDVLVLQNNKDLPVIFEELGHASSIDQLLTQRRDGIVVKEFSGGWAGAGHHQSNYIDYLANTDDPEVTAFLTDLHANGFSTPGTAIAVDISVPESSASGSW